VVGKVFNAPQTASQARGWRVRVVVASLQTRPVTINVNDKWVKQGQLANVITGGWSCNELVTVDVGEMPGTIIVPGRNELTISTGGVFPHMRSVIFDPIGVVKLAELDRNASRHASLGYAALVTPAMVRHSTKRRPKATRYFGADSK